MGSMSVLVCGEKVASSMASISDSIASVTHR